MKHTLAEISLILKERYGIQSKNTYPKTILHELSGEPYIACYPKEMKSDFYYYDEDNDHMYVHPVKEEYRPLYDTEEFEGALKYKVPFSCFDLVEKVEPLQDAPFSEMTIRDFYSITHNKPLSKKEWLNELIRKNNI